MELDVLVTIVSIVFILIISIFGSKLYLNNKILILFLVEILTKKN